MAILFYVAGKRIAEKNYIIPFFASHDLKMVFVRAEHVAESNLIAALDHVKPLDGETFLNAIPDLP